LIAETGGGEIVPFAEQAVEEASRALVVPAEPAVHGYLTPEQLVKHEAYRAKKKQKQQKKEKKSAGGVPVYISDEGLPLARTPSPPVSPPLGPVQKKWKSKKKAAGQRKTAAAVAAVHVLSAKEKKLLQNRAAESKHTKLQKLKAEALLLETMLVAKQEQHKLLLAVLASATTSVVAATLQQECAVETMDLDLASLPLAEEEHQHQQ